MRKNKKLEEIKKDLHKTIKKKDLGKIKGGKKNNGGSNWNTCGGVVPQ